ncbi:MAG: hypothetical protein EPO13_03385 [Actinomycetota bacterium]|nr:MAG: hypothetical protein EPO13_03385 [Actinomycetota bacterium]
MVPTVTSRGGARPPRRWSFGCLLVAATVTAGLLGPASAAQAKVKAPKVDRAAAAAQCPIGAGASSGNAKLEAKRAAELYAGTVVLGSYGTFRWGANPSWKPKRTLDASGNANMHGLDYLLPLLREGVRTANAAYVNRFYAILRDWVKDNPKRPLSSTGAYSQLPQGLRLVTMVCAVAGPQGKAGWLRKALKAQADAVAKGPWVPGNNTALAQSLGLLAAGQTLRRGDLVNLAAARIDDIAGRALTADGSDRENAIQYGLTNYVWYGEAAQRLAIAGRPTPANLNRIAAIPSFLAWATRPDGRLEAVGDSSPVDLPNSFGDPAVAWSATQGAAGAPPSTLFATFAGGYAFGRSGWGTGARSFADETFYSVRYDVPGGSSAHQHADAGALTLASHGAQLLFDSGPYRYANDAKRAYVRSRAAHNVVDLPGVPYTAGATEVLQTRGGASDDLTFIDHGYAGATVTRTIHYDRAHDLFVVWDTAESDTPRTFTQNWQLGRDRSVVATNAAGGTGIATTGAGANLTMRWAGPQPAVSTVKGRSAPMLGWNSQAYGELVPAPTVQATQTGTSASWLTVLVPRRDGVADNQIVTQGAAGPTSAAVSIQAPGVDTVIELQRRDPAATLPLATAIVTGPADGSAIAATGTDVTWAVGSPAGRAQVATYRVVVDGTEVATVGAGTTSYRLDGLGQGPHTVRVDVVETGSVRRTGPTTRFVVDTIAPVYVGTPSLRLDGGALSGAKVPTTLSWNVTDNRGVVRQLVNGAEVPAGSTSRSFTLGAGAGAAIGLQAFDRAGNAASQVAVTGPIGVDPRGFTTAAGWRTVARSSLLGGTAVAAKRKGVWATATVSAHSIGIVGSRMPKGGTLQVFLDGALVATIDLRAPGRRDRQLLWVVNLPTTGTHQLALKAKVSKKRPQVVVDGLVTL